MARAFCPRGENKVEGGIFRALIARIGCLKRAKLRLGFIAFRLEQIERESSEIERV